MANIEWQQLKHLGTLSGEGRFTKEVNIVSWNGREPVIDIRTWDNDLNRARKGVTVTLDELPALIAALKEAGELRPQ